MSYFPGADGSYYTRLIDPLDVLPPVLKKRTESVLEFGEQVLWTAWSRCYQLSQLAIFLFVTAVASAFFVLSLVVWNDSTITIVTAAVFFVFCIVVAVVRSRYLLRADILTVKRAIILENLWSLPLEVEHAVLAMRGGIVARRTKGGTRYGDIFTAGDEIPIFRHVSSFDEVFALYRQLLGVAEDREPQRFRYHDSRSFRPSSFGDTTMTVTTESSRVSSRALLPRDSTPLHRLQVAENRHSAVSEPPPRDKERSQLGRPVGGKRKDTVLITSLNGNNFAPPGKAPRPTTAEYTGIWPRPYDHKESTEDGAAEEERMMSAPIVRQREAVKELGTEAEAEGEVDGGNRLSFPPHYSSSTGSQGQEYRAPSVPTPAPDRSRLISANAREDMEEVYPVDISFQEEPMHLSRALSDDEDIQPNMGADSLLGPPTPPRSRRSGMMLLPHVRNCADAGAVLSATSAALREHWLAWRWGGVLPARTDI